MSVDPRILGAPAVPPQPKPEPTLAERAAKPLPSQEEFETWLEECVSRLGTQKVDRSRAVAVLLALGLTVVVILAPIVLAVWYHMEYSPKKSILADTGLKATYTEVTEPITMDVVGASR